MEKLNNSFIKIVALQFDSGDICILHPYFNFLIGKNGIGKTQIIQSLQRIKSAGFGKNEKIDRNFLLTLNELLKKQYKEKKRIIEESILKLWENYLKKNQSIQFFKKKIIKQHPSHLSTIYYISFQKKQRPIGIYFGNSRLNPQFSADAQDHNDSSLDRILGKMINNLIQKALQEKIKQEKRQDYNDVLIPLFQDFNKIIKNTELDSLNRTEFIFKSKNPNFPTPYTVKNLSDGEKSILFWTLLCKKDEINGSLILSDEWDNHLHPDIIHDLIRFLKKQAEKLNLQFIFSTHSPQAILSSDPSELCTFEQDIKTFDLYVQPKYYLEGAYEHLGALPLTTKAYFIIEGETEMEFEYYLPFVDHVRVLNMKGCSRIKNTVKFLSNCGIKVVAIRDRDGISDEEIDKLKKDSIYTWLISDIESEVLRNDVFMQKWIKEKSQLEINKSDFMSLKEKALNSIQKIESWKKDYLTSRFRSELNKGNTEDWDELIKRWNKNWNDKTPEEKIRGKDHMKQLFKEIREKYKDKIKRPEQLSVKICVKDWIKYLGEYIKKEEYTELPLPLKKSLIDLQKQIKSNKKK
ncbi:MAG: ATP-binding protein [Candidatus Lokiarchaeota archaeon]|nr:ATP-binding protein [Candidatus Harpocratesius repetitus]